MLDHQSSSAGNKQTFPKHAMIHERQIQLKRLLCLQRFYTFLEIML